jgi:hypothetical protein
MHSSNWLKKRLAENDAGGGNLIQCLEIYYAYAKSSFILTLIHTNYCFNEISLVPCVYFVFISSPSVVFICGRVFLKQSYLTHADSPTFRKTLSENLALCAKDSQLQI